jgi:hypothetical protein
MAFRSLRGFQDCRPGCNDQSCFLDALLEAGYRYALSSADIAVGHDILGRFYLENRGKTTSQVREAAVDIFRPYVNMVRPAEVAGDNAPKETIEDNRVFLWLGSSGRGLGIGVFVRVNKRLQCVLMPGYSDDERAAIHLDFLRNDKHELWVRESQFSEKTTVGKPILGELVFSGQSCMRVSIFLDHHGRSWVS